MTASHSSSKAVNYLAPYADSERKITLRIWTENDA